MKVTTPRLAPAVIALCTSLLGTVACSANYKPDLIGNYLLEHLEIGDDQRALVGVDFIATKEIAIPAYRLRLMDRIPPDELVLVSDGNALRATVVNKSLVEDWEDSLSAALDTIGRCIDPAESADTLAWDLSLLVVDPDSTYFRVLHSADDIPVDIEASDKYRDLSTRGVDKQEIRRQLLRGLPESLSVAPPAISEHDGVVILTFTTWNYFGGEILSWAFSCESGTIRSSYREVARYIGSYDFYM